ncbi:hypothetical protein BC830DRAFT_522352 [Chytriomyces sp. MP71]|nr:hypothetical protein BC830DRAFT_522352 [Chytriomyces sp. MP71]
MSQYPGNNKAQFAQPPGPPPAMYAQPGFAPSGGQPAYATQPGQYPQGQGTPQVVYVQQPPQQQNNAMGSSVLTELSLNLQGGFCFGLLACCAVEELLCCVSALIQQPAVKPALNLSKKPALLTHSLRQSSTLSHIFITPRQSIKLPTCFIHTCL